MLAKNGANTCLMSATDFHAQSSKNLTVQSASEYFPSNQWDTQSVRKLTMWCSRATVRRADLC